MRIRFLFSVLGLAAVIAVLSAQAFDLRLGQWEYTMSGMKMAPEALAKMPPSARAAMEQMMKQPQTNRSCLTADDLKYSKNNPKDPLPDIRPDKCTGVTGMLDTACGP